MLENSTNVWLMINSHYKEQFANRVEKLTVEELYKIVKILHTIQQCSSKFYLHFETCQSEIRQYLIANWENVRNILGKLFPELETDNYGPDYIPSDDSTDSEFEADFASAMSTR